MKYYAIPKGQENPNSVLWNNLATWAMRDLKDLDPTYTTWLSEHIASDETQEAIYDKVKARIAELKRLAVITAQARARDLFNENHPRPETGF